MFGVFKVSHSVDHTSALDESELTLTTAAAAAKEEIRQKLMYNLFYVGKLFIWCNYVQKKVIIKP